MLADHQIERLIKISKEKPLLPEKFIPWEESPKPDDIFLPDDLISLKGHPLWNTLSKEQQIQLGKHEMVQAMYSYAWSEGLACFFFSRHNLTLQPNTVEYKFLLRELIEEFRHQEMFAMAIEKVDGDPIKPSRQHRFWGNLTVKYLPASWVFMSVLAVEMIADVYGKIIRRNNQVYNVLRKVSELHHIEEGRHIYYTKIWLKRFTDNAGWFKRTTFSMIILLNIYFMRTLYVKEEIFSRIGVDDPKKYQRAAYSNFRHKYADQCLDEAIEFVEEFNGFNWFTKPLWRLVIKAKI